MRMSLSSILSSFADSRAVATKLGSSPLARTALFLTLVWIPFRKRLFGIKPFSFSISFLGKRAKLYARDSADIAVLREVFVDGEYVLELPREPRHIVDIGGHAGYVSVFFALTYPHASIRTFEPDPGNFSILQLNTAAYPNIATRQVAVSHMSGKASFYASDSSISSSLKARLGTKEVLVETVTLDDILKTQQADLVKFDIEGTEYELFTHTMLTNSCPWYIGEMHYDLTGHTRDEFLTFFPGYQVLERAIAPQRTIMTLNRRD